MADADAGAADAGADNEGDAAAAAEGAEEPEAVKHEMYDIHVGEFKKGE